jgi:hypothetical protein
LPENCLGLDYAGGHGSTQATSELMKVQLVSAITQTVPAGKLVPLHIEQSSTQEKKPNPPPGQLQVVPLSLALFQHLPALLGPHGSPGVQVTSPPWHAPFTQVSPGWQQVALVPVPQSCAFGQHVLPISVVPLGHSHRQVSELTVPPSQATHWSPHAREPGSSHSQNPSTQVAADGQQMAKAPVPQTCAVGQQASPCKQASPVWQHSVPHSMVPLGQPPSPWHTPFTHCSPSSQRLKHSPQWRSFVCRFTHLYLQRVLPSGQPQTLWSPHLTQFLEQHWKSLRHSRPKRLQSLAQATPGKEANAAPRRAPPIHLIALPLERVPVASPFASSSKERLVVCWLTCCPPSPKGGTLGD